MEKIKIATRGSRLALWQANLIKDRIEALSSEATVELLVIKTKGDKILDSPLAKIGGKGLFVKELETALLNKEADLAVHSMKDVPMDLPEGLEISVITERETNSDAFVSNKHATLKSLPEKAVVGTSSLRRAAQVKKLRPDLEIRSLRGNVDTRLRKLDQGEFDAIILAAAGLIRLGLSDRITELISSSDMLPAVAQGALGIESRGGDARLKELISPLNHEETAIRVNIERALLKRLNGGCQVPLAGEAVIVNGRARLAGLLASPDGSKFIRLEETGKIEDGPQIGVKLAEKLLAQGGREILSEVGIEVQ